MTISRSVRRRPTPLLLEALEARCLLSVVPLAEDLPVVQVTSSDTTVSENGDTGKLTFTRTGDLTQTLTVRYRVDGTANTDISQATLTFQANQAEVNVTVTAVDDQLVEGEETVVVTLLTDSGYTIGPSGTVTLLVEDNDNPVGLPVVTVQAPAGDISEGLAGQFIVTRTAPTAQPLTVNYTVAGTATSGSDYNPLSGSVIIAPGQTTAVINLSTLSDDLAEGSETVQVVLSFSANYAVGEQDLATATIVDGQIDPGLPQVTVTAQPVATEDGQTSLFTFTRTGSTDDPLTVAFDISGNATEGSDYQVLPRQISFGAGASTATLELAPIDDADPECAELVTLTLVNGEGYRLSAENFATVLIRDNDLGQLNPGTEVALGDGGAKAIGYVDADGTIVAIKLSKGSGNVTFLGDNITTQESSKGIVLVLGDNVRIDTIHIEQSSLSTALKVVAKGGDGRATARVIRADGDVGQIVAKTLNIGCEVFIDGSLRKSTLGSTSALGDSIFWIAGSGFASVLVFDQVQDMTLISEGVVKQVKVNNWLSSANGINEIRAASAGKIMSKGNLSANVNLTDAGALMSLQGMKLAGDYDGGVFRAASSVKQIAARSLIDSKVLVGMDPSAEDAAVPGSTVLFTNRSAVLSSVKLKNTEGAGLVNSVVSAWVIGKASLSEVETSNNGTPLGLAGGRIGRVQYLVNGQAVKLAPVNAVPMTEQEGDFVVRHLGATS